MIELRDLISLEFSIGFDDQEVPFDGTQFNSLERQIETNLLKLEKITINIVEHALLPMVNEEIWDVTVPCPDIVKGSIESGWRTRSTGTCVAGIDLPHDPTLALTRLCEMRGIKLQLNLHNFRRSS